MCTISRFQNFNMEHSYRAVVFATKQDLLMVSIASWLKKHWNVDFRCSDNIPLE